MGYMWDIVFGDEETRRRAQSKRDKRDDRRETARKEAEAAGENPDEAVKKSDKAAKKAEKTREKEAKLAEESGALDPKPIDFQCILLERLHILADHHQGILKKNPPRSNYGSSTIITDPLADPGTVMSRIHHGGQTAEVKEIMSLCPDVHGLLSPYIKISRVEYDKKTKKPTGVEKPLRIPNFLSPDDVSKILSGDLGRAAGAGIKSFKWELKGVQPAEVDNNISATLVLYFQSIGDFFAGASDAAGKAQAGRDEPTFLDLIINSPGIRKKKKKPGKSPSKPKCNDKDEKLHRAYEGDDYRIKVCAGWAVPPNLENIYPELNKTAPGANRPRYEVLATAIAATRVSLFLQMVKHDISFNQNGSLTLTVDYQAAISGLATSPNANILMEGTRGSNIADKRAEIKKADEEAKLNGDDPPDHEEKLKEIDELEQADRKEKYDKLLKGVYGSNRIYSIEVPIDQIVVPKLSKLPFNERQKIAQQRLDVVLEAAAPTSVLGAQTDYVAAASDDDTSASEATEEARKKRQNQEAWDKYAAGEDPNVITISYIYLGDLLDTILATMPGGEPGFDFLLSEVEVINLLVAARKMNIKNKLACKGSGNARLFKRINIGDIPISLDAFQAWFLKNVVDKQRDKYYFLKFVKDVCSGLVTNALRSKCYGPGFNFSNRFDVQPLSLYQTSFGGTATVEAIAKAKSQLGCHVNDASKFGSALVLVSTDSKGRDLKGNFNDDINKGIYHHYIGSACSLIKTLDFQREDQPYLREARLQKEGALGAEQLRELYSVNIKLVGNNLYRNGSLIYVSPLLINTTKEQLSYLGLHGYYLVTSVSSELTENSFITSITALQEGIEFPDSGDGNTTPTAPEKSPSDNPKRTEAEKEAQKEKETGQSTPPTSNEKTTTPTEEPPSESTPSEGTPNAARGPSDRTAAPNAARRHSDRIAAERKARYDRGENPIPSLGSRGRLVYREMLAAERSGDRAREQGGSATLEGYDSNTGRQDDPELARQATEANEG